MDQAEIEETACQMSFDRSIQLTDLVRFVEQTHEGNPNAKHPGPSPKTVRQEEIDRGLKEGLAKKGEEQGGL